MSSGPSQIMRCPDNHLLKYISDITDSDGWFKCKICNQSFWSYTAYTYYQCDKCEDLFICQECYNSLENQTQLNWLMLCNECQSDHELSNRYRSNVANANAICLIYGYFRLNDTINTKYYSYQDLSIICLKYFWEFYKVKIFYDKYYSDLVTPKLLHLRPLIDKRQIGLIKYILNHTKTKYINNFYTTNNNEYGSILWQIISEKDFNDEIFSDETVKELCIDYHIDINKHFKGIFTKISDKNIGGFHSQYIRERTVKEFYSLFNKELNIDYVDEAIDKQWFDIATFLINKGCKITQKCYNQYFEYLIENQLNNTCTYKTMNSEDLYKVYNDKNECFNLALAMKNNPWSNHPEIAMAELLYSKFNKDININYTKIAIQKHHRDLLIWMINNDANIEVDDIYNNWYVVACQFVWESDAIPIAQCFYDKFEGNINMNYISDLIKKDWINMFEWMIKHKTEVTDKHWLQIISSADGIRWKDMLDVLYEREQNVNPIIDCINIAIKDNKWKLVKWMIEHGVRLKEDSFDNIFTYKAINNYNKYYWGTDKCGDEELEFAKKISQINPAIIHHDFKYYRDLLAIYKAKWGPMSYWLFTKIHPTKYKYFEQYIDLYFRYYAERKRDKTISHNLIRLIIQYYPHTNIQDENESFETLCELMTKLHDQSLDDT